MVNLTSGKNTVPLTDIMTLSDFSSFDDDDINVVISGIGLAV